MSSTKVLSILFTVALLLAFSAAPAQAQCKGGSQLQTRAQQSNAMPALLQLQQQSVLLAGVQQSVRLAAVRQQQRNALHIAVRQQQQVALLFALQQQNAATAQLRALQMLDGR